MALEGGALSDKEVQELIRKEFVAVHLDPKKTKEGKEHKKTRFVPELGILDSDGKLAYTVDIKAVLVEDPKKSVEGVLAELKKGLEKAKGKQEKKKPEGGRSDTDQQ